MKRKRWTKRSAAKFLVKAKREAVKRKPSKPHLHKSNGAKLNAARRAGLEVTHRLAMCQHELDTTKSSLFNMTTHAKQLEERFAEQPADLADYKNTQRMLSYHQQRGEAFEIQVKRLTETIAEVRDRAEIAEAKARRLEKEKIKPKKSRPRKRSR